MQPKKVRVPTTEQAKRHASARETIQSEFPPKRRSIATPPKGSIADQLRNAREAHGLTWYAVAKAAGIPNSGWDQWGHPYIYCTDSHILVKFLTVPFIPIRFAIAGGHYG